MIAAALLNGLWQGALVYALAWLVLRFVPTRNATTRYAIWFVALVALAAIPVVTLLSNAGAHLLAALQSTAAHDGTFRFSLVPAEVAPAAHWFGSATTLLSPAVAMWICGLWAAGTSIQLSRLGLSFVRIARIRSGATPLSGYRSDVLVSKDVEIPIVAGIAAPAVVVPAALARTLDPKDLERVIEHERAHLRRNDVVGNAVQRVMEAVLFFNPWTYLIGRQLIAEREAACDDWVVNNAGEARDYAACLAAVAQRVRRPAAPLVAPSAFGSRHALVIRIERLMKGNSPAQLHLNYYAVAASAATFVALTLALQAIFPASAFANPAQTISPGSGALVASACKNPNAEAAVLTPAPPMVPASAPKLANAWVTVLVTIGPNGKVTHESVQHSSGSSQIDEATLDAAKRSTYSPKLVDCKPVAGSYVIKAKFAPTP
jgi:TonB family protein